MTSKTRTNTPANARDGEHNDAIQLSRRRVFRIDQRLGDMEIQSLSGTLWLTLPNDPNDYVLRSGDRITVQSKGKGRALLQALSEASFTIN